MSDTPESAALALGKLIGTVDGLVRTLNEQNQTASRSREEFMKVFEGIRSDNKEQAEILQAHMKDDNLHYQAILELMTWKKDTEPKVDDLWDSKNRQKGVVVATTAIGGFLGGLLVWAIEFFKNKF